jgi:hypothetical protein
MTPNTYTINAINANGTVDVTFSVDGKRQNIDGLPVGSADALTAALNDYAVAYAAGLEVQAANVAPPVVPADVSALVGQPQTVVDAPASDTPAE